ncbi:FHA domain-containing protein [Lacisediminihabitans changchengi]|uniref:FHA domain-containing protein n=1 Tax=Lacisediminihabitans changchengi TaxID=2787634 RepID=A0A934SIK8_9MICO|nr:FHA domain-containing protein [Lacisediminihabitans changchengi]MBK4346258.1 FHA domain-containing protein [Lacisediminihabitans changchengi]
MTLDYVPAVSDGWLALCSPQRVLLIETTTDAALITSLHSAIREDGGIRAALDLLARNGLAAIPSFALVEATGEPRVIVRGGVTVTAMGPDAERIVTGAGVTTWSEQVLAGATRLTVSIEGATAASGVGRLPISDGISWVASLSVGAAGFAPTAVTSQPVRVDIDPEATVSELPEAVAAAAPAPTTERGRYDDLFGDTMYRDVAGAAVAEEPEASATEEPQASAVPAAGDETEVEGDHDGQTVLTSDIAKLRTERNERKAKRTAHSTPVPAPAPHIVLTLPNGSREPLAQPILVGRAPSVTQISGGQVPRLITVGTADQDISRTHARFVLEGETVVVTDLHSRNGTMVVLPGKEPQKLRAGEPTAVIIGTVVDFGGGITLRVDED